jgi:nucleoside-diphosphate-sugar epimerase
MTKILITGATGFVGQALTRSLSAKGLGVVGAVRVACAAGPQEQRVVGSIGPDTDWRSCLNGVECVIHTAARAHILKEGPNDASLSYRINVEGTQRLLDDCSRNGLKKFVYLSSIAVYGANAGAAAPIVESSPCAPDSHYGITKLVAEDAVLTFGHKTGAAAVVLRPPLIYGPGAPGNWRRLVRLAALRLPIPFGAVRNERSLLGIENLCDAVATAIGSEVSQGQSGVYNIADSEHVSLAEILSLLRTAAGKPEWLINVPPMFLESLLRIAGKSAEFHKMAGDLKVDSSKFRSVFSWQPPYTTQQGIVRSARFERHIRLAAQARP